MASSSQTMYTTTTAVKAILPPTLPTNITTSNIETRIRDASAYIDSRVKNRYSVSFTTTPEPVETMTKEAAAHMLRKDGWQKDRSINDPKAPFIPVWIDSQLKAWSEGKEDIPGATVQRQVAYFPEVESA